MDTIANETSRDIAADKTLREMNAIMRRKITLLNDMRDLSEQAGNYIDEESVGLLQNLLDAKQELIREVDRLDRMFLTQFNDVKTMLGVSSLEELSLTYSPELGDLRDNTSAICDLLNKIYEFDKKFNGDIRKLRDSVAADLTRIRRQKQISRLYTNEGLRTNTTDDEPGLKHESSGNPAPSKLDIKK